MGKITFDGGSINKARIGLEHAVGRNIVCEDGVTRLCHSICFSHRYKHLAIVNELDPESNMGHWVHLLSLSCQLLGDPLPTREQKEAFTRYVQALYWEETGDEGKDRWLRAAKTLQNL